jgi:hypothetical protein
MKYQVYVGNIGKVYDGDNHEDAMETFEEYVVISANGHGRASGEDVTLFEDGDIIKDFIGKENETY